MRHLHPLFSGNQYLIKDNPETPTDFINIYLKESTSISEDVDAEVDKIFNMIPANIKNTPSIGNNTRLFHPLGDGACLLLYSRIIYYPDLLTFDSSEGKSHYLR